MITRDPGAPFDTPNAVIRRQDRNELTLSFRPDPYLSTLLVSFHMQRSCCFRAEARLREAGGRPRRRPLVVHGRRPHDRRRLRAQQRGGAQPVAGPRRGSVPRVRHAADAREGLLRLLVRKFEPINSFEAYRVLLRRCAGIRTSTRSRPTRTCAASCSRRKVSPAAGRASENRLI